MKIKKRTETINMRVEKEFKERLLKYSYLTQESITEILEKSFEFYVKNVDAEFKK